MMKRIKFFLAVTSTIFFAQALQAQISPVVLDKTASDNGDGTYSLTLKSYLTGKLYDDSATSAADIVFLVDVSKKLNVKISDENLYTEVAKPITATSKTITKTIKLAMTATKHDAVTTTYTKNATVARKAMSPTTRNTAKTQNWTYDGVKYGNADGTANYSYYYKDANGDFYAVHKWSGLLNSGTGSSNVYAIGYVDKNGETWYLTTDGVSRTYKDVTGKGTTLWNGTLYTSGWAYQTESHGTSDGGTGHYIYGLDYGDETGTAASQWYYLHTDGEYYPVRRSNILPDGNGNNDVYAAWVVIDGVTWYLHGDKLDTDYDRTMRNNVSGARPYLRALWFGTLYKGGWKYTTILEATVDGGHYALYGDKYYPVQKGTEEVGGVTTYQAFVEIPGVGKRYLFGTGLSTTPCPYSTSNGIFFYFGDLYTGGWKYGLSDFYDATAKPSSGNIRTVNHYLHSDGQYYPIRKVTEEHNGVTTYQAYVELPEGKRYFDGNGLSENPYLLSTSKYVTLYFGQLYKMNGWSSAEVVEAKAGAGNYYLHSDNKYYAVVKESTPGTNYYQLYVDVPEGKRYLWGHSLHTEPCPYSASQYTIIWYGSLYKGGWSYNTITVNTSDKQGYSYRHPDNGQYYPIFRETVNLDENGNVVTSGGTATYQDYVLINNEKWYLYGNEVRREPYPYSVKNTVNNWFGPLYSGGWTYANITPLGTAASGLFYLHEGKYYPVLHEDNTSSAGSTRYQAYIEIPGVGKRYLYGTGISENPYPFSARTNVGIYYGQLYTGGWTYSTLTNGTQYVLYDGQYYPITKQDRGSGTGRYQAYVDLPIGRKYLAASDLSDSFYGYASATGSSLYFNSLYEVKAYNKDVGLQRAICAFIDEMNNKNTQTGLNHRIAFAQFGLNYWAYDGGGDQNIALPHLSVKTSADANRKATVLSDFFDVSTAANVTSLKSKVNQTIETGAESVTRHSYGLCIAKGLFRREGGLDETTTAGYDYDGNNTLANYEKSQLYGQAKLTDAQKADYAGRQKIVIIIGDGVEQTNNETNRTAATTQADAIKADPNAKIYYVHVGTTRTDASASFEESMSSGSDYCRLANYYDEELTNALLAISQEIGGEVVSVGNTTIVQDVVAPEFTIATGSTVELFTANCTGASTFASEEDWESFTGTVSQTTNLDGTTTIRVSGFDFDANWCGDHGTGVGYSGKQLIVRFNIAPKEGIVGGIVATNTDDSKLFRVQNQSEIAIGTYPIPHVTGIPMNIQISKSGLREGDSAIFTIRRKLRTAANFDSTVFMRVILTGNAEGTPVTADIVNLDPAYIYLIEEGGWSYTYTPTVNSISTEDQTTNPFEFGNTARTNITYDYGEREVKKVW